MDGLFHFLQTQTFFVIFGVVAIGMALGRVRIGGISLGSVVCIILAGLAVSIWASSSAGVSLVLPDVLKTIFFNLFIFAMGVKIGPQFFAGLERDGWRLVAVGATVAVLAPIVSLACSWFFALPPGAVAGLLAGSNNSSAAFGAATSALQTRGAAADAAVLGMLSAAFALCYAVSEIAFVLFMKWLPWFAGVDPESSARSFEQSVQGERLVPLPGTVEASEVVDSTIAVRAYRLSIKSIVGMTVGDLKRRATKVSLELVRRSGHWLAFDSATVLERGDEVVVSGPVAAHESVRQAIGPELPDAEARSLMAIHTVDVVVTRDEAAGQPLADLIATYGSGIYPNALFRAGEELLPGTAIPLKKGDVIRVSGTESHLADFGRKAGRIVRASHSADVLTIALGLLVGAALGAIPIPFFGVRVTFGAAAVLMTGILFGWFKTRHPAFGGPLSEGARRLMEELGLNVFTAVLAVNSGEAVYRVMTEGPVWALAVSCLLVSSMPALIAWWLGHNVFGLNPAVLMGAIAGARQNTASLHVAQRLSQSSVPGIGYPVPLAIATMALTVVAYFLALFAHPA